MINHRFLQCYRYFRKKIFTIYLILFGMFAVFSVWDYIPDTISVPKGESVSIGGFLPVTRTLKTKDYFVEQTFSSNVCGTYKMQVRLFGVIPVKDVTVNIVNETEVIPCGMPIGIYVHTEGVLVVDIGEVRGQNGVESCPSKHILKPGDYITTVNGVKITEKEELVDCVTASGGEAVELTIQRDGEIIPCVIEPTLNESGQYRIGAWVRDDMAGIGTLTFLDKNNHFGALGHSISDVDTVGMVKMSEGKVYLAQILRIIKGEKGTPGELVGQIAYERENIIGEIETNNENGIFGTLQYLPDALSQVNPISVGYKQQIQLGKAEILMELNGTFDTYEIEIENVDMNPSEANKSIRLRVTDQNLIKKTGGIVQGLSGSPIIQDGKLVGAVTHVLVNDPTCGYGIFIENMLDAAK